MKFRTLEHWVNIENLDGLLFFAQRLDEMLFDYTLDTYKPPVLCSPYICIEAISLISDIENKKIDSANLKHVLEELEWCLKNDLVAKSLMDTDCNQYFSIEDNKSLSSRQLRLEVLAQTLNSERYLHKCQELLETAVIENRKNDIETLIRLYVSRLINGGLSKKLIFEKVEDFFFKGIAGNIDKLEKIREFFEFVYPYSHNFEMLFAVDSIILKVGESVRKFGIKISEEIPEDFLAYANEIDYKKNQGQVYVITDKFRAQDVYSAREIAERKLDSLSDLFMIFAHKARISWQDSILVKQCCTEGIKLVGRPQNTMEKGIDLRPDVASERLNRMIKRFSVQRDSFERFDRVVDLHGMSIINNIPENQLLNTWISLETITPTHVGNTKINEMIDLLIPIFMLGYSKRIINRLAFDLIRWDRRKVRGILAKLNLSKGTKLSDKVLILLTNESSEPLLTELYTELSSFPLLRYRIFSLHRDFKTPKNWKKRLDIHKQKVAWQIRRIYRTRNIIVHSGKPPKFIHSLIENAHDYLDQVLYSYIELSCENYRIKTLEQCFELCSMKWEVYQKKLNAIQTFDEENCKFIIYDAIA
ncbi:hypothetical protein [Aeromonas sp. FDAARGOS 1419]|uniref:hypothetical protein n=1 Tax=Aeromonas TaxID=642 RepID=UPI001C244736|nr:hypothetical protein [Aeromonas sp. FDAARGOS 1419]QWZ79259.1 hypothetical protein I6L49_10105 [Aeromonas sp. FDAARGOS 1419]